MNVADAIRRLDPQAVITAIGTRRGLDATLIPERGYPLELIPPVPLPRKPNLDLLRTPVRLASAVRAAGAILHRLQAEVLVGFGSYVALPSYLAARRDRIPIVVHEANARAGVANRVAALLTPEVFTASASVRLAHGIPVGMPLRPAIAGPGPGRRADRRPGREFGLRPDLPTLLVTGGSQGAVRINRAVLGAQRELAEAGVQVLHIPGPKNPVTAAGSRRRTNRRTVVRPYLSEMAAGYAAADFVLCRSGAMTVAELTAVGLPACYVPLPLRGGEQGLNAEPVVAAGGGLMVPDAELSADWISANVLPLLRNQQRLAAMATAAQRSASRDAAEVMAAGSWSWPDGRTWLSRPTDAAHRRQQSSYQRPAGWAPPGAALVRSAATERIPDPARAGPAAPDGDRRLRDERAGPAAARPRLPGVADARAGNRPAVAGSACAGRPNLDRPFAGAPRRLRHAGLHDSDPAGQLRAGRRPGRRPAGAAPGRRARRAGQRPSHDRHRRHPRQDHHDLAAGRRGPGGRAGSVVRDRRQPACTADTNGHAGSGPEFIVEADESDGSFLLLHPDWRWSPTSRPITWRTTVTWKGCSTPSSMFVDRIAEDGLLIVCADDPGAARIGEYARALRPAGPQLRHRRRRRGAGARHRRRRLRSALRRRAGWPRSRWCSRSTPWSASTWRSTPPRPCSCCPNSAADPAAAEAGLARLRGRRPALRTARHGRPACGSMTTTPTIRPRSGRSYRRRPRCWRRCRPAPAGAGRLIAVFQPGYLQPHPDLRHRVRPGPRRWPTSRWCWTSSRPGRSRCPGVTGELIAAAGPTAGRPGGVRTGLARGRRPGGRAGRAG